MRGFFTLLLSILLLPTLTANPWPRPQGGLYLKLYEFWLRFDEHYTSTGELDPNATLGLYNTALYGEYGLMDRLTAVVNLPFYSRNVINNQVSGTRGNVLIPGEAIGGPGDVDLAARYALTAPGAAFPVSATLTLGLPLGEDAGGEQGNLQTGDGEFNQLLALAVGRSFAPNFYAAASVGINNRTQGFSDEFRYGLEAGLATPNRRFWLIGRLSAVESFFNGATAATVSSTSIFSNNAEFISFSGEINVHFSERIGLSVGAATVLRGRIIAAAPAYSAGVFLAVD